MINRSVALVALVACSGGHHHGVDAPPADTATDTLSPSTGDPPANAVALYVTQLGQPATNVAVYFQHPDSSVLVAATTDSRGLAWALASAGDFVTTIEPVGPTGGTALTTFAAVQPGDVLHLDLQPVRAVPDVTLTLKVKALAGAVGYVVHNSCGDPVGVADVTGTSVTFADCGNGVIDLVIVPVDDQNTPLGARYVPDVAIFSGGVIDLSALTYVPFDPTALQYSNVPSSVSFVNSYEAIVTQRGRVFDATNGAVPSSGIANLSLDQPNCGSQTALTVTDGTPTAAEHGEQLVYQWKPWASPYALDLTAVRLPEYAGDAGFDAATAAVTWTERSGGMPPNVVRARIVAYRDAIPVGRSWSWRIAAPRTGTSVVLPHLPNDGFDFNPAAGDSIAIEDLTNALVPGGYDAIRAHAFDDLGRAISGPTGTMIVELPYSPTL